DTTTNIMFYVRDDRTSPNNLHVQAASSNPVLIPQSGVRLSDFTATDQGLRVKLSLTPLTNQFGDATITITATDRGGLSASRFFVATVIPVNDSPAITAAETLLGLAGAPSPPLPIQVSDLESSADQLVVTGRSLAPTIVPESNLALTHGSGGNWNLVVTPATAEPAQAQIELTVTDPEGAQAKRTVNVLFQRELLTPFGSAVDDARANQLLWADFNGDRRMELLISRSGSLILRQPQPDRLPQLAFVATADGFDDLGDVDNDGDLDLLVHVNTGNVTSSRVFVVRNLGGFRFEQMPGAVFTPGAARFADFDLDGRLDVWVAESATNLVVYRNTGAGFEVGRHFALKSSLPDSASVGSLTLMDFDADGRDELVLATPDSAPLRSDPVFRWTGDGFVAITNFWASRAIHAIADFDQDGLPDLFADDVGSSTLLAFWRNQGGLEFLQTVPTWSNPGRLTTVVADFDGDGVTDMLFSNSLYLGSRDFTFARIQSPLANANVAVAAPADFDGDGVMDIALSMSLTNLPTLAVYRGGSRTTNRPPASPPNLRAQIVGTHAVMLSWDRATDPEQSGGLTYNVRVGTAPGLADVISPMSLPDGFRMVVKHGNAGWSSNRLLTALQPGRTYYA
ncbi:MAG: hypothetical protein DME18_16400, partial [Verrucomicrobia bacterium]